jgi:hypothetical protein
MDVYDGFTYQIHETREREREANIEGKLHPLTSRSTLYANDEGYESKVLSLSLSHSLEVQAKDRSIFRRGWCHGAILCWRTQIPPPLQQQPQTQRGIGEAFGIGWLLYMLPQHKPPYITSY